MQHTAFWLTIVDVFWGVSAWPGSMLVLTGDWWGPDGLSTDILIPKQSWVTTHVSSPAWPALHRCMIITSQGLPVQARLDKDWAPSYTLVTSVGGSGYLLFSPAGLFEDKFGDVGSPGIGHVCGQVVHWVVLGSLQSTVLSPLSSVEPQQSGLRWAAREAGSAHSTHPPHCLLGTRQPHRRRQISDILSLRYLRY